MPRRYKNNRRYKRKYKRRNYVSPSKNLGPLAVKTKSKFIYHEDFGIQSGVSGVPGSYVFSMNGLYDPNITGTGHQPRGWDQLMTLYDHAVVIYAKATLWCANEDATFPQQVTLSIHDGPVATLDKNAVMENRYIKSKVLAARGSGKSNGVLSIACNPNKFLARTKPLSDPHLKNSTSSNPTEQAYLHIHVAPMNFNADATNVYCKVRIEYTAVLLEPTNPGTS